jgi:hypothetical protein
VLDFPIPFAERVYVVVAWGETTIDPEVATLPIPGVIITDVAFKVVHDKTAVWPRLIDVGETVIPP